MLRNYIKAAYRNLLNNKGFTFINILGLAIGIASFIIISLFVYHELSYDRYHEKGDRIFRIVENLNTDNEALFQSTSSPPMGPAFAREFPEVTGFVRFLQSRYLVRKDGKTFLERECYLADSSVFDVFSFPLLKGNSKTALTAPHSIVLTESTAKKYFRDTDPVGQMLEMDNENYTVTGVMGNVPENSHFTFDMLISFTTFSSKNKEAGENAWFWNSFHTYLILAEGSNIKELRAKVPAFIEKYIGKQAREYKMFYSDLPLQPLTGIYLEAPRSWENGKRGSESNLFILSIIAVFILLIACFNYINLATARASRRLKEVGLRKVLGADRAALVWQFLGESIIVCFIATLVGALITLLLLPRFNMLTETSLSLTTGHQGIIWIGLLILSVVLGILSGAYPAFVASGFHPLQIFKKTPGALFSNQWLRKMLVSSQFIISITLIAGTVLVFQQLTLLRTIHLGFDKEKTLILDFSGDGKINDHYESVKSELKNIPDVTAVSTSYTVPGESTTNLGSDVEIKEGVMSQTNINTFVLDYDFIPNYDIKVAAGRTFSRDFPADDTTAFMINEAAAKNFGWKTLETALGRKVDQQGKKGTIVGVVRDFHYRSLHLKIEPLLLHINKNWFQKFSVKIRSGNIPATVAAIGSKWKTLAPDFPFHYSFLDQDYDRLYKSEDQLGKIVSIFSALAIFIASLGLIGLTSYAVERRFKEIAIRKVLGASAGGVVVLISREFMRLILVSFIIAIPITYYMINLWLDNFTDRISINPVIFVAAGLSVLLVSWLVISYLSMRAALANPVESLRTE
jgi:putative ABC transport system permease protein